MVHEMCYHKTFIGLGSNLGDREGYLRDAIAALKKEPDITVTAISGIYETKPVDYKDQPDFLNMAVGMLTTLSPQELLETVMRIEQRLGRRRSIRFGPRTIDVDILFYDDWVLDEGNLQIPHPRLHERAFVLCPLVELAGEIVHPVLGKTVQSLLEEVSQKDVIRL